MSLMSLTALVSCRSTVSTTSDPICREYETKYPTKDSLKLNNAEASKRLLTRTELTANFNALSRSLYNTDKYAVCLSLENGGAASPYDVSNAESGLGKEYVAGHCKFNPELCAPIISTRKAASAPAASSSSAPAATVAPTATVIASTTPSASGPTASVSASSTGKTAAKVFVSVSPASGPVGTVGSITVTVRGQIEEEGEPLVSISGPSGIVTSNVSVVNRNTIKVDINLVDATPGRNTVSVSIGDKVIGAGSFTVYAPKAPKAGAGESGEDEQ